MTETCPGCGCAIDNRRTFQARAAAPDGKGSLPNEDADGLMVFKCDRHNDQLGERGDTVGCFRRQLSAMTTRAEAAEAVVADQPKTEDGMPVVDIMTTYCEHGFPHRWDLRSVHGDTYWAHTSTEYHYSTPEVAEAAQEN